MYIHAIWFCDYIYMYCLCCQWTSLFKLCKFVAPLSFFDDVYVRFFSDSFVELPNAPLGTLLLVLALKKKGLKRGQHVGITCPQILEIRV